MFDKERTTFARYPYVPTPTSAEQLLSIYLARCEEPPRFQLRDLDRHVLAIDVRRFHPEAIEEALEDVEFAPTFWELEYQLDTLLIELIDLHGDPTLLPPLLHQLPALITTDQRNSSDKQR